MVYCVYLREHTNNKKPQSDVRRTAHPDTDTPVHIYAKYWHTAEPHT
jgi:hypothetical protein